MRAVVYDGPRRFSVRDLPTPEPGPGEVRVRVRRTGLCATDLHLHEGHFLAAWPMVPGHETVGVVDELGDGVTGLEPGQQVVLNPHQGCGACSWCREGRDLLCPDVRGMGSNVPGGFAEHVVRPAGLVLPADGLDPDVAVLAEPTACATHGIEVLDPRPGGTALVVGAGPTGLLLAQLLGVHGAAHVTVAAPVEHQLRAAERFGIDATYLMDTARLDEDVAALHEASGDEGYDVVVDATGVARVAQALLGLVRSGGTVLLYGVAGEDDRLALAPYDVFRRQLTVKGSYAQSHSFPAALAALRSGRVRTDGLITHRFPLEEYAAALDALRSGAAHKVVVTVSG